MKPFFLIPILLHFSSSVFGQISYKENSEINFTQAWVWEYKNELIPENEFGHQGEMVVYFHPELQYWLFTVEAYGVSGEMFDWILAKPDGTYLIKAKDEFGKSIRWEEKLEFKEVKHIPEYYFETGETKIFNQNDLGYEPILGKEFKMKYEKTEDETCIHLAEFPINFDPIYFFNQLNLEAKIPVDFPNNLPGNQLVLEDKTQLANGQIRYKLNEISNTEYFVDLHQN